MGEVVHTTRGRIVREEGPTRRAIIEGFGGEFRYGVHGGIANFYKVRPKVEHPATLDHIITALASWMMGTLAGVLAKKNIPTPEERFEALVEGDIENVDNVLKITEIRVKYRIDVPKGKTADAQDALSTYIKFCPGAQSVIGCIRIKDEAEIKELEE